MLTARTFTAAEAKGLGLVNDVAAADAIVRADAELRSLDEVLAAQQQSGALRTEQAFAANGFELPNDELSPMGRSSGYLTATLH